MPRRPHLEGQNGAKILFSWQSRIKMKFLPDVNIGFFNIKIAIDLKSKSIYII